MPAIYNGADLPKVPPAGYTGALQYVWIGDSLIVGTGSTNQKNTVVDMFARKQWETQFYSKFNIVAYSCANAGVGGNTTTQLAARIAADAISLASSAGIVINGGVNDINAGTSESLFLSNWTAMLDACVAAGIPPIVLLMGPWTNADETKSNTRDAWNISLSALVAASYPTATVVDTASALGQFRVGGPVGNLWDIITSYSSDGLHLNNDGYIAMARAIDAALN